jgi:predicted nuclease of predicted toxin-antitoxin system
MRFKIDENLHDEIAAIFIREGHDVHTVRDEGLRGTDDTTLAEHCVRESRVLVTLDLDFADIRIFPPTSHCGIIVLRVADQSRAHVRGVISRMLTLLKQEPLAGRLWIVSESGVRIRGG